MPITSNAVVFTARNHVAWQEIESPDPGPDDVVVEIHHSWISNGTEGSFLRGERISGDTARRPGDPDPFPMVAGYQKVGRVLEVGATVKRFKPGDMVFASMSRVLGMFDNEFAGHVSPGVCAQDSVMPLPPDRDPLAFAGLVLTQVGYNCGTRPNIRPGELAVVIGDGLVGQWTGQTLAARGARVVMVGRHDDRLAHFAKYGDTVVSDAAGHASGNASGNRTAPVRDLDLGPVQVLVETSGSMSALDDYLPLMQRNGHMVIAGFYPGAGDVDILSALERFRNHEITFDLVSGATAARLQETMQWIADGRLNTLDLISHRFPVEQAADAWDLIESKREPVLGVVLDWPAGRP